MGVRKGHSKVFVNSDANHPCFLGHAPEPLWTSFIKWEGNGGNTTSLSLKFPSNSDNVTLHESIENVGC